MEEKEIDVLELRREVLDLYTRLAAKEDGPELESQFNELFRQCLNYSNRPDRPKFDGTSFLLMQKTPMESLGLPEETEALFRETGAENLYQVAGQLNVTEADPGSAHEWEVRYKLGTRLSYTLALLLTTYEVPLFEGMETLSGPFGVWTSDLLTDVVLTKDAKYLSDYTSKPERYLTALVSYISYALIPEFNVAGLTGLESSILNMHYRLRYGRDYIIQQMDLTESGYDDAAASLLSKCARVLNKFLLRLQNEDKSTEKRMRRRDRFWICALLSYLFPDICTDEFFDTWHPLGGLKVQEKVIDAALTAASWNIPGAREGDILRLLFQKFDGSFLDMCEALELPVWEAEQALKAMVDRIRQDQALTDLMCRGFEEVPIGDLNLAQLFSGLPDKKMASVAKFTISVLSLSYTLSMVLTMRFHVRYIQELLPVLFPEPELGEEVAHRTGYYYLVLRTVFVYAGLYESFHEAIHSIGEGLWLLPYGFLTGEIMSQKGQRDMVISVNRMGPDPQRRLLTRVSMLVNTGEPSANYIMPREDAHRLFLLAYYFTMPMKEVAEMTGEEDAAVKFQHAMDAAAPFMQRWLLEELRPNASQFRMQSGRGRVTFNNGRGGKR